MFIYLHSLLECWFHSNIFICNNNRVLEFMKHIKISRGVWKIAFVLAFSCFDYFELFDQKNQLFFCLIISCFTWLFSPQTANLKKLCRAPFWISCLGFTVQNDIFAPGAFVAFAGCLHVGPVWVCVRGKNFFFSQQFIIFLLIFLVFQYILW